MISKMALLIGILLLLPSLSLRANESPVDRSQLGKIATTLKTAIDESSDGVNRETLNQFQSAIEKAAQQLGTDHIGGGMLRESLKRSRTIPSENRKRAIVELRNSAREVYEMLTFRPVIEADTPVGFPGWTPVGKIEVKKYPAYRMAKLEMPAKGRQNSAFFTLFSHIKKNDIKMTAPVEMEYRISDKSKPAQKSMAFLYASPQIGTVGETPTGVEVVDLPPKMILSIGMRGRTSEVKIEFASDALKSWLQRNREKYAADGDFRVMGYNSPFVMGKRRYYEVQVPVRVLETAQTGKSPQ